MNDPPQTTTEPDLTVGSSATALDGGVPLPGHAQGEPGILVRRGAETLAIGATCNHHGACAPRGRSRTTPSAALRTASRRLQPPDRRRAVRAGREPGGSVVNMNALRPRPPPPQLGPRPHGAVFHLGTATEIDSTPRENDTRIAGEVAA